MSLLIAACLIPAIPVDLEKAERVLDSAEWSSPVNGIRGRFFSVKDEYEHGEELQFVFIFQNVTEKPVYLPGFRLMETVTPRDAEHPTPRGWENLRIILDEKLRLEAREMQLANKIQELRPALEPGELRLLIVSVRQGILVEDKKDRLRHVGEPDRESARLPLTLNPGEHKFRAVFAPAGLPVPEGVERLEEKQDKRLRIWEGKTIALPPTRLSIAEPNEH